MEVGVEQDRLEQHPVGVAEGLVEHVLLASIQVASDMT
jgi:hypothetical protein